MKLTKSSPKSVISISIPSISKNCIEVRNEIRRFVLKFVSNFNRFKETQLSTKAFEDSVCLSVCFHTQIDRIQGESIEFDRTVLPNLIRSLADLMQQAKQKRAEDHFSLHLPWLLRVPLFPRFVSLVFGDYAARGRRNRSSMDPQHFAERRRPRRLDPQADPRGNRQSSKAQREIRGNRVEIAGEKAVQWEIAEGKAICRIERNRIRIERIERIGERIE